MIKIYTDGSASKKSCGFGMVVFEDEKLKFFHSDHCEDSTNNREEMKDINAHETLVPVIGEYTPSSFGVEEFNFLDRNDKRLKLFSSSESLFAYLASMRIKSYKDLHFSL